MLRPKISKEEIVEAYIKLKSHIYYDTTELFQRRALAEFETGLLTDEYTTQTPYGNNLFGLRINKKLDEKLDKILEWINNHHKEDSFEQFFKEIKTICLPKKFQKKNEEKNFLTNQRIEKSYGVERITVFADIPIELHLVSVLWIMKYGFELDNGLDESCTGNRLILTREKDSIVKGSGLFKPYFTQYQNWRDKAVEEAQRKLKNESNIAFINLDLKDYFYSAKINFKEIENTIWGKDKYKGNSNLHEIFKEIHRRFTKILIEKNYPYPELQEELGENCVLPIGVASSYVIGNWYLREFDNRIKKLIPQVYYSRYVDDILIVIENPDFNFHEKEDCLSIKFSFDKYKRREKSESINFSNDDLTKIERYLLETLYPVIKIVDYPKHFLTTGKEVSEEEKRIFKITCVEGAYFQGAKTLLYYFDYRESTAVIDKLKQELEERASEFRDFPEDGFGDDSFDEQAYHLIFDGSEGKIRTLKDYKENRYGLSVFLANRIFAALRQVKKVDKEESEKLLKLFKGLNNIEHFRLWEKIFTFFLVNEDRDGFVAFYKHTIDEIAKLNHDLKIGNSDIECSEISSSLLRYFDIALEMSLALNPQFLKEGTKAHKDLEIFQNKNAAHTEWLNNIKLTSTKSHYIRRFRRCNLIRHHYVAHPLLNYTKAARQSKLNLVDRHLPDTTKFKAESLEFSDVSKSVSPRLVKFWECCIAVVTRKMLIESSNEIVSQDERYQHTELFNHSGENKTYILSEAFKLYREINEPHFTSNPPTEDRFFKRIFESFESNGSEKKVEINELRFNDEIKFEQNPLISIANTIVDQKNIEASIKGKPVLSHNRYKVFSKLLKESRKEKANILVLPEFSVPYEFVSSLAKYSDKNQLVIIAGLEHWTVADIAYNFIVTIIPISIGGVKDAVVLYRLKNHYAHIEELIIRGFGYKVPKPVPYQYDLINWQNLYFTSFYCFELADTYHRSLFRSKVDLLIASEWNKDTPYFSNIVEALSRDLHCYIAQVNTSQYGDSRLTQPSETARKDILKLKGGKNDAILVGEIAVEALREFQLKYFERIKADNDNSFKPVPPDWDRNLVKKRINNENILNPDD